MTSSLASRSEWSFTEIASDPQAKPAQAKPAQAKPAQAKPTQAKPAQAKPAQAKPTQAKPAQAKPTQAKPAQAKPAQAKPAQAKPAHTQLNETRQCDYATEKSTWSYYHCHNAVQKSPPVCVKQSVSKLSQQQSMKQQQSMTDDLMTLLLRVTQTVTRHPQLLIQPVGTDPLLASYPDVTPESKPHDLLTVIYHLANVASSLSNSLKRQIKVQPAHRGKCQYKDSQCVSMSFNNPRVYMKDDEASKSVHHSITSEDDEPYGIACIFDPKHVSTKAANAEKIENLSESKAEKKSTYILDRPADTHNTKLTNDENMELSSSDGDLSNPAREDNLSNHAGEGTHCVTYTSEYNREVEVKPADGTETDTPPSLNVISREQSKQTNNTEDPFCYDTTPDNSLPLPKVIIKKRPYTRRKPLAPRPAGERKRKLYTCDHCSYTSVHSGAMSWHRFRHSTEKPYACDFEGCDFRSAYERSVEKHKLTHSDERKELCDICGMSFKGYDELRRHKIVHGFGAKDLKCPQCDFKTIWRGVLQRHMKSHTGEKPYKCTECSYTTNQRYNLVGHMRTHTGEKPHKCDHCDYAAAHRATLTSHIKYKHEKK